MKRVAASIAIALAAGAAMPLAANPDNPADLSTRELARLNLSPEQAATITVHRIVSPYHARTDAFEALHRQGDLILQTAIAPLDGGGCLQTEYMIVANDIRITAASDQPVPPRTGSRRVALAPIPPRWHTSIPPSVRQKPSTC